jgi:1,4-dihydroxy-6-naphthoate synthase
MKLAISTCPNDTFAFHAILNRKIDFRGLEFEIELLDIQQLNEGLLAGRFDVAKASFHAAIRLAESTVVLPSGAALGFGVGPLLLAATARTRPDELLGARTSVTLCPGELTTAAMLFQLFYGGALQSNATRMEQRLFSEIMPALVAQSADFGVCIHEGRFTWQGSGIFLVEDLGTRWENETSSPLPLGGIVANRRLPSETIERISLVIRDSVDYAMSNRQQTLPTMRRYAQEFSDNVLLQHVDLYVNQWTVDLGDVGRKALDVLAAKAAECGLTGGTQQKLEVWS